MNYRLLIAALFVAFITAFFLVVLFFPAWAQFSWYWLNAGVCLGITAALSVFFTPAFRDVVKN